MLRLNTGLIYRENAGIEEPQVHMNTTNTPTRWLLKKSARAAVATTSITACMQVNKAPRVRALTYHRFGNATRDPFCVTVQSFDKQMAYIANRGLALSLGEFTDFLAGRNSIAPDSVLVTIDDGFRSTYSAALPVLRHYGIPAVAFISPGLIEAPASATEPYVSWDEARMLHEGGIEIGSHSMTHRSVARISDEQAREEILHSREILEARIGQPISAFAYPFGTRADYNESTSSIIRNAGYECAFTSQHGAISATSDAFTLPRIKVEGGENLWLFKRIACGGLDAWRWIDRALWRIQASDSG